MQWQTVGDVQIDTGANASAEEAEETLDDSARKVVDIIESFRLVVRRPFLPAATVRLRPRKSVEMLWRSATTEMTRLFALLAFVSGLNESGAVV